MQCATYTLALLLPYMLVHVLLLVLVLQVLTRLLVPPFSTEETRKGEFRTEPDRGDGLATQHRLQPGGGAQ
jgi:hypothetical protein